MVYDMGIGDGTAISAEDVLERMENDDSIDMAAAVTMSNEDKQYSLAVMSKFLSVADQETLRERISEDIMWHIKEELGLSESKRIKVKILRD